MNWISWSLLSAFTASGVDVLSKFILKKNDPLTVAWLQYTLSFLCLLPFALMMIPSFQCQPGFWFLITGLTVLDVLSSLIYLRALQLSPLSLTLPFLAFTPFFSIFTGNLFLGEHIGKSGMAGIFLISLGAYLLYVDSASRDILAPVKAVFREPGSRLMLLVSFLFSVSAAVGKKGIQLSSPQTMSFVYPFCIFLGFTFVYWTNSILKKAPMPSLKTTFSPLFLLLGGITACSILIHFTAISMTQTAYMIAIKRMSILIGVIGGFVCFKERFLWNRLLGTLVMLAGMAVISLW